MRFKMLAIQFFMHSDTKKEKKRTKEQRVRASKEERSCEGIYESYNDRESKAFLGIDLGIIKINKRICKM